MELAYLPFQLKLEHPFTITHESRTEQPTLIVSLQEGGHRGLGEATATAYYGVRQEEMIHRLGQVRPLIESLKFETPEVLWNHLQPELADFPALLCALDMAAHDLYGKWKGKPLYRLWGLSASGGPLSNYTIGQASIEQMVAKMKAFPWPVYKIKLGTDHDLDIIRELRRHTDARFRVDANTAWTPEQTISLAPKLKTLGVEFIEQPLPVQAWEDYKRVKDRSVLPIIADESCQVESDVDRCIQHFHGINIKLVKCGGLTPALRMIERARALGLKVMVGCMTESSVGISAIGHLTPLLDYVDMDGALLLADDPAEGVKLDQGRVVFNNRAGSGAVWLREGLEQ